MAIGQNLFSGGSVTSNIGTILFVIAILVIIFSIVLGVIIWSLMKRRWTKKIPLYKGLGENEKPYKHADHKAREVKIGRAGDKLWFVKNASKYINVATESESKNSFPHYEASDGEWHNFSLDSFDPIFKKMKIKLIPQDMRVNRLGIESAIEKELAKKKTMWDMVKDFIPHLVFYLVVVVCVVIIFFQFGKISDKLGSSALQLAEATGRLMEYETRICVNDNNGLQGLVPAFIPLMFAKFKRRRKKK